MAKKKLIIFLLPLFCFGILLAPRLSHADISQTNNAITYNPSSNTYWVQILGTGLTGTFTAAKITYDSSNGGEHRFFLCHSTTRADLLATSGTCDISNALMTFNGSTNTFDLTGQSVAINPSLWYAYLDHTTGGTTIAGSNSSSAWKTSQEDMCQFQSDCTNPGSVKDEYFQLSGISVPPPGPTLTLENATGTIPDFQNWVITWANASSGNLGVAYGQSSSSLNFSDLSNFVPGISALPFPVPKQHALWYVPLSIPQTWYAEPVLQTDTAIYFGDLITFQIDPNATAPTGSTSTLINYSNGNSSSTYGTLPFATATAGVYLMSTSTCNGYLDLPCALGNVFASLVNFLFGVNVADIQQVAGFQLATTKPFNIIPEIQNDFLAASINATSTMASSSLTFNLGSGSHSVGFYSPSTVQKFIPLSVSQVFRSLLYLMLIMTFMFGAYIEIKAIFGHKNK